MDGSIPNCVGLPRENWCRKEVTMVNDVGEGVASGFVEFARASQIVDGRTALGDDNVGVSTVQPGTHGWGFKLPANPIKYNGTNHVHAGDHNQIHIKIEM
jgi:hypothetical protein